MNLLTIEDVRVRLGYESDDDSYDTLLVQAMPLVTSWFEQYCDRGLAERTVTDEEFHSNRSTRVYVWAYPISTLDAVSLDGIPTDVTQLTVNKKDGYFYGKYGYPALNMSNLILVSYTGGYPQNGVPEDLAQAYADAVGAKCGITTTEDALVSGTASASGTSAIKSIGLGGGALAVAFDTGSSSTKGGITGSYDVNAVPVEVQNYASVLNYYKRNAV